MTQTVHSPRTSGHHSTGLSRAGAGVLVAAPAVALLARVLLTPVYQDDQDRPDHAKYLADVADATLANDIGATLTLVCAILFGAATVVVAGLVRPGSPRVARVGEIVAIVGAFSLASHAMAAAVVSQAARVDDREAMIALLDRTYDEPATNMYYIGLIIGSLGWLVLAFGLARTNVVGKAAATIAGIGVVATFLTTPGPIIWFVAGGAALSLVGMAWVAATAPKAR